MSPTERVARQVQSELIAVVDGLIESDMVLDSNRVALSAFGRDSYEVSWAPTPSLSYLFGEHTLIKQYREALEQRHFLVLLLDGAMLQCAFRFEEGEVCWHRLCYLPCPVALDDEMIGQLSIAEIIDLSSASEIRLVAPLRFDFDPSRSNMTHPASHLTIGKGTCRLPVFGPLSLGHFVRFVLQQYYQSEEGRTSDLRSIPLSLWRRTLPRLCRDDLYLDTGALP